MDPNHSPPITDKVAVTIQDNTAPANFIDPEALGVYYILTDQNLQTKHKFYMGYDASNVSLIFDSSNNTNIIIYPTPLNEVNDVSKNSHKTNVFPPSFTLTIGFPISSKTYNIQYQDISSNQIPNIFKSYTIPGTKVSGNFISIVSAISASQTPIFSSGTNSIGYITCPSNNTFSIKITESGNTINGFIINLLASK
jgi:hypothetical protein